MPHFYFFLFTLHASSLHFPRRSRDNRRSYPSVRGKSQSRREPSVGRSRRMKEDLFETRPKRVGSREPARISADAARCSGRVAITSSPPCPPSFRLTLSTESKKKKKKKKKKKIPPSSFFLPTPVLKFLLCFPAKAEARRPPACSIVETGGGGGDNRERERERERERRRRRTPRPVRQLFAIY